MLHQLEASKVETKLVSNGDKFEAALRNYFVAEGLAKSYESAHEDLLDHVKEVLKLHKEEYIRQRDPRAIFTDAYEQITVKIRKTIEKEKPKIIDGKERFPRRYFDNPMWVAALDYKFVQIYLEATDYYDKMKALKDQGNLVAAKKIRKRIRVWAKVFDMIGVGEPVPSFPHPLKAGVWQELILPLFVHTFHDLPLALAEIAVAEAKEGPLLSGITPLRYANIKELRQSGHDFKLFQRHVEDFHRINFILLEESKDDSDVIDRIQEAVARYDPFLKYMDRWLKGHDEDFTYGILKVMRGMIWSNATRLIEATEHNQYKYIRYTEIPHQAEVYVDIFYGPGGGRLFRMLSWISRFISGLTRAWPQTEPNMLKKNTVGSAESSQST